MKKALPYIAILAIVISVALQLDFGNRNTPENVAKEWLTAYYNDQFEVAKKLSTTETKAFVVNNKPAQSNAGDTVGGSATSSILYQKLTVKIKSVQTKGNEATVIYTVNGDPDQDFPPLKLVKEKNKWLVQVKADAHNG